MQTTILDLATIGAGLARRSSRRSGCSWRVTARRSSSAGSAVTASPVPAPSSKRRLSSRPSFRDRRVGHGDRERISSRSDSSVRRPGARCLGDDRRRSQRALEERPLGSRVALRSRSFTAPSPSRSRSSASAATRSTRCSDCSRSTRPRSPSRRSRSACRRRWQPARASPRRAA